MSAVAAGVSLTARERAALVEVVTWSRRGAWSAAARFASDVVKALRLRGLVHGDSKLWATRAGTELINAGL